MFNHVAFLHVTMGNGSYSIRLYNCRYCSLNDTDGLKTIPLLSAGHSRVQIILTHVKFNLHFFQVTCYCGRPFAGRPMIECSRCLTWVHLKCAKLTRQRIPETWFCQKCKSLKGNDIISEKKKTTTSLKGKKNDDLRKI